MLDVRQMAATCVARTPLLLPEPLDCARLSGRSTREERRDMTSSLSGAASAPVLPAAGVGEKLLDAVAAYGAYKHGRDWQNSGVHKAPRRLTLVPSESAPAAIAPEADGPAMERLLVAVAGERVWEGEGSFPS